MEKKFKGIFSALITPFDKNGKVNVEQLEKIVEFEVSKLNIDGLYVCGSTGEAFLMGYEERSLVMKVVANVVKNKLKANTQLVAQIGGLNIFEIEKLAKDAKEFGYHGISAVTPFYYGFGFADIKKYYELITSFTDLPLLIYYLPALTAVNISLDNFVELLQMKNVAGAKYSSPDLFMLERLIAKCPDKTFLFGVDEFLMAATTLGIDGAIGSTYNLMGMAAKNIFALAKNKELDKAKVLTTKYNKILKDMLDGGIYQTLKQSVAIASGVQGEIYCRTPMRQIDEKAKTISNQIVKELFADLQSGVK
ncbi:MAG: N-acetylneuraminate lyase [Malacoplasma sp.]|nr:N-acetylneuraminate lyase [Malacoplasma sp.]MDE6894129.1 N-acetylneuraminate lyase [Malacoplasma sp.]MDE7075180.1 N-acetylneuraminate lyase [Malacoplasma sp.]